MRHTRPLSHLLPLLAALLAGCAGGRAPAPRAAETAPQREPYSVRWVRSSAEYRAAFTQTYRLAAHQLRELVRDREPGSWAVALDADETLVSNVTYSVERRALGEGYTPESWEEWIARREAPRLPGVADFLATVRALGGHIAVVTNRIASDCPATRDNLLHSEIDFDILLCKDGDDEKEPRWELVERGEAAPGVGPLEIVMWVGDNITDFPGLDQSVRTADEEALEGFGVRYFVLPNPLYGSWEDN